MQHTYEDRDLDYLRRLIGGDGLHGPGDDAALLRTPSQVLVTIDPVVEGQHFEPGTSPARVGRKLVHRSFSDLAAMAAWPVAVVASFCFGPSWKTPARRVLYRAVLRAVRARDAAWIGGDLAAIDGPAVLTLCAIGRLAGRRAVPRRGLRPGHLLLVTGPLGNSLASGWHLDFEPRLEWGCRLGRVHRVPAMMDISDGLLLDLSRMLRVSGGLGATVFADRVPRRGGCALAAALGDGEDHELLVGVSPRTLARIARDRQLPPALRQPIGVVEARPGLRLVGGDGRRLPLPRLGFQHELA